LESDERIGQALGGPAIEVVAKVTRWRFTVGTSGRSSGSPTPIGCRTRSGVAVAGGAILLPPDDLTRGRERGELAGPVAKKRGPVTRVPDPGDKRIADVERENLCRQRRR